MTDSSKPLAQWLNATMASRGLSQADVAREVGVADVQVSRWRRGQVTPSVRYLQRIADTFDVPRATLDRMAGYPSDEAEPQEIDPKKTAELQAYQARLAGLMEEKVPRELWRVYADACAALVDTLSASFRQAQRALGEDLAQGDPPAEGDDLERRNIGFRTHE
jgi:transcriptional regulator with XRE-family HTH domain